MDELEFQAQFRPPAAGSVAEVLARRLGTPDIGELTEAAAERAAADARAAEREQLVMANRAAGDPLGQVTRHQAAVAELRGELADLEARAEAVRSRLTRTAENLLHWIEQADEVRRVVSRSNNTGDLLAEGKAVLAGHLEYVQASRAAVAAVQAGTPRQARRPFGNAVRSEMTCKDCIKYGFTPEESFLHHQDPHPPEVPAVPSEAELDWQAQQGAQREGRARRDGTEIRRTFNDTFVSVR